MISIPEAVAALSKITFTKKLVVDGISLWSNGHILIPASDDDAIDYPNIAGLWEKVSNREDTCIKPGRLTECDRGFFRHFTSDTGRDFPVNELYWRIAAQLGELFAIDTKDSPLAIRKGRELIGIIMPSMSGGDKVVDSATDADVFSCFAAEENGWYLQCQPRLRKELMDIEDDISTAKEKRDDLDVDINRMESVADRLRRKLKIAEAEHVAGVNQETK